MNETKRFERQFKKFGEIMDGKAEMMPDFKQDKIVQAEMTNPLEDEPTYPEDEDEPDDYDRGVAWDADVDRHIAMSRGEYD